MAAGTSLCAVRDEYEGFVAVHPIEYGIAAGQVKRAMASIATSTIMEPVAGPSPELMSAIDSIVASLRAFLRDLDEEDVPVSLRRVVAATGRKLPAPLLRSLLVELDRNEWLRSKAVEALSTVDDPDLAAYLVQAPGWWIDIADRAVVGATAQSDAEKAMAGEIAKLTEQLDEAKRRTSDLHETNAALGAELKANRAKLRDAMSGLESRLEAPPSPTVRDLEHQLEEERKLRYEADARVSEVLRRREARQRRAASADNGGRTGGVSDAIAVARRLDLEMAALGAAARGEPAAAATVERSGRVGEVGLPAGVLPDAADAVAWLLTLTTPVTLIVDGYNVGYLLDNGRHDAGETRRRLLGQLDRFDRLAAAAHRIVVVFDSEQAGASGASVGPSGIEVRFATEAASADDAIVDLVAALTSPAVVVTNDRELRERVDAHGALSLWSSALAEWVKSA